MPNQHQVEMASNENLIHFKSSFKHPVPRFTAELMTRPVHRWLAINEINRIYANLLSSKASDPPFNTILRLLDIDYLIAAEDLTRIPRHGPLVVVANHPFGGIEGIILGDLLQRIRPDTKILGNYLLERIAPIRDSLIPVDPFGGKTSVSSNVKAFRTSFRWLKAGNSLITFPAGEVSHYCHQRRRITDPPWGSHVAALIRMSGARVLPVFFPGRNSMMFNLMGLIHPRLRTLMLPRELVAKKASRVSLFVGRGISPERIDRFHQDSELIRWLRFNTYFLANRMERSDRSFIIPKSTPPKEKNPQELIQPVDKGLLAAEVAALPETNCLVTHKQMSVFIADSEQIPYLLREIGRLREKTFRKVQEGTGNCMDVDLFDSYYRHLVLWNTATSQVVGAYRVGDTSAILSRFGRKGLYTHSLFRFKTGLLRYLTHSLELGRSFIRWEYQRQPNCLALLWKGIGAYLVQHPEYRILFGPVSISNSYHRVSKHIMIQFLQRCCTSRKLMAFVRPRRPVGRFCRYDRKKMDASLPAESIDDVSMLVSEIEDDDKRVPVLIKHYLRLNGQFIAFNLDRDFSDAIDGLVVVDLIQTDPKILQRFMGRTGYRRYIGDDGNAIAG